MDIMNKNINSMKIRLLILLTVSIALVAGAVYLLVKGYESAEDGLRSPVLFSDIVSDESKAKTVAYIDIVSEPEEVCLIKHGRYSARHYYVVSDGEKNYAAIMSATDAKNIAEEVAQNGKSRVKGCSGLMKSGTYEMIDHNFPDALGKEDALEFHLLKYADVYHVLREDRFFSWYLAFILVGFCTAVISFAYMLSFRSPDLMYDEKREVEEEINSPDTVRLKILNCYAGRNWLVGVGRGFHAVKYSDIEKIFFRQNKYNGITVAEEFCVTDKYGKKVVLTVISRRGLNKKADEKLREELDIIRRTAKEINSDIVFDFYGKN